jgi:hypothetical protein
MFGLETAGESLSSTLAGCAAPSSLRTGDRETGTAAPWRRRAVASDPPRIRLTAKLNPCGLVSHIWPRTPAGCSTGWPQPL